MIALNVVDFKASSSKSVDPISIASMDALIVINEASEFYGVNAATLKKQMKQYAKEWPEDLKIFSDQQVPGRSKRKLSVTDKRNWLKYQEIRWINGLLPTGAV